MSDTYVETTTEGYGSRIKNSFQSVIVGFVFVALSIGALIWNESNLVQSRRALDESEGMCSALPTIDKIDSEYEGKLVYLTGAASVTAPLTDTAFGIDVAETLKIRRSVEMYQWVEKTHTETKKNVGGSKTTTKTYSYAKDWKSWIVPTEEFHTPQGHENPAAFPFEGTTTFAKDAKIGAFLLSDAVLQDLHGYQDVTLPTTTAQAIPEETKTTILGNKTVSPYGTSGLYVGTGSAAAPQVGDVRVTFSRVPAQTISVIAEQEGQTFGPFTTSNDRDILLVESGNWTMDAMFDQANKETTQFVWIVRGVCFLVMWFAFAVVAGPMSVFADVIPCLGSCVESLALVISFVVAFCVSLVTIALAWLWFRPVFSLCVFAGVGIVAFVMSKVFGKKDKGYEEISLAEDKAGYTDNV